MKKLLTFVLAGVLAIGAVGCANKDAGEIFATAATREWSETDADHVYIDEEAIALAQSVVTADMTEEQKTQAANMRAAAKAALEACNAQRASSGLGSLTWSDGLESCAMVRAQEAVSTWSHTRPNGSDWYTVNSSLMYGENLAKGYSTAEGAVAAWMASPTHADNILHGGFKTCGIAIYEVGGTWYWAEEFGY